MTDDLRNIVLGVTAAGISASLGRLARTYLLRRRLRRKQAFFGLPAHSECLLVVNRYAGAEGSVHRYDVFALLELSALIKDCAAHAQIVTHDVAQQGFGERTEFCVGGPTSKALSSPHRRHIEKLGALGEPKSLAWLRQRVEEMLPKIDLSDLLFEVTPGPGSSTPSCTWATAPPV